MLGCGAAISNAQWLVVRLTVAVAAVAAASLLSSGASAQSFFIECPTGSVGVPAVALPCTLDPLGEYFASTEYELPTDGRFYRWDITFESADPLAFVTLDSPSQAWVDLKRSTDRGETELSIDGTDFVFSELPRKKDRVSYLVGTPADFDFGAADTPAGVICAAEHHVWGNGTRMWVGGVAPVTILS